MHLPIAVDDEQWRLAVMTELEVNEDSQEVHIGIFELLELMMSDVERN